MAEVPVGGRSRGSYALGLPKPVGGSFAFRLTRGLPAPVAVSLSHYVGGGDQRRAASSYADRAAATTTRASPVVAANWLQSLRTAYRPSDWRRRLSAAGPPLAPR